MIYPTRLAYTLFLLASPVVICVLFFPSYWLVAIALWSLLLLCFAFDLGATLAAKTTFSFAVPRTTPIGAKVGLEVLYEQFGLMSMRTSLFAEVSGPIAADKTRVHKLVKGRGKTAIELKSLARGVGVIKTLWAAPEGPLRLFRKVQKHAVEESVDIIPDYALIRGLALASLHTDKLEGAHWKKQRGDVGEFEMLAPYSTGAVLRQVDWKHSARHQALLVRRYRLERGSAHRIGIRSW